MSSLNLQPNLPIIVLQAGVFVTNLVIIKKLMLEPFLRRHHERLGLTTGKSAEAKKLADKNTELFQSLTHKLEQASSEAQEIYSQTMSAAQQEKDARLSAAEKSARAHVASVQASVKAELAAQSQNIPRFVAELSEVAYRQVMG